MQTVISLYTNGYSNGAKRLEKSLVSHWGSDYIIFKDESSVGAPPHHQNNYAFKVYAFEEALRRGYTQILWVDASLYAVDDIDPIFDRIDKFGYMMQEAGHMVGNWCNDRTLKYFGITRDQAMKMPMFTAGFLGLNMVDGMASEFFGWWKDSMKDGQFNGSWTDHRHDMTCGSIIANLIGLEYQPGDQLLQYASPEAPRQNDTIVFKAQGIN